MSATPRPSATPSAGSPCRSTPTPPTRSPTSRRWPSSTASTSCSSSSRCRRTTSSTTRPSPGASRRRCASTSPIVSLKAATDALALGAASVINIKAGRVGGYLEAVAIHDLCRDAAHPGVVRRHARDRHRPRRQRRARGAAGLHAARRRVGVEPVLPPRHRHRAGRARGRARAGSDRTRVSASRSTRRRSRTSPSSGWSCGHERGSPRGRPADAPARRPRAKRAAAPGRRTASRPRARGLHRGCGDGCLAPGAERAAAGRRDGRAAAAAVRRRGAPGPGQGRRTAPTRRSTVGAIEVDDPRFDGAAERVHDRESRIAAGATVSIPVQLPPAKCPAPDEATASGDARLVYSRMPRARRPRTCPIRCHSSPPLHNRECRAARARGRPRTSRSRRSRRRLPGSPADLTLTIAPTGTAVGGGATASRRPTCWRGRRRRGRCYPIAAQVRRGRHRDDRGHLPLVPLRCDPHAVQEDKRGTVFTLDVEVDGEAGEIELAGDRGDARAASSRGSPSWCGFGS